MAEPTQLKTKYPVKTEITVRFADVDLFGHLNHAKFFTYMEEVRVRYMDLIPDLSLTTRKTFHKNIVLVSISCDFISQARMGEVIAVTAGVTRIGGKSFTLEYQLTEKTTGRAVGKGISTVVAFDFDKNHSIEVSKEIRQKILEIEGVA